MAQTIGPKEAAMRLLREQQTVQREGGKGRVKPPPKAKPAKKKWGKK